MPDDSPQSVPGAIRRRLRGFLLVSFKSLSVRLGGETSAPTRLWERTAPPIVCQRPGPFSQDSVASARVYIARVMGAAGGPSAELPAQ
jgi:hypothetical protein